MAATLPILESIRERLFEQIDRCEVELFPDDIANYYVKNEYGAILVQYAGSKFESIDSSDIIQQRRAVHIAITVIARSQHNDFGALELLDKVRLALVGFRPTNCTACHLQSEEFTGEAEGLWQYQLLLKTETWQIQCLAEQQAVRKPKFIAGKYDGKAVHSTIQPK